MTSFVQKTGEKDVVGIVTFVPDWLFFPPIAILLIFQWHTRVSEEKFDTKSEIAQTTPPCQGGSHVARLDFETSRVGVYKCLSLIVGFAVTVTVWLREVVSCRDFILRAIATFWAMSLVRIYPGRASKSNL